MAEQKELFSSFGFIQYLAAVHIFAHHLWQQTKYLDAWKPRGWGPGWVACFFVLSGFKLSYSQLKRKDPLQLDPPVPFFWRRLVRLYPQYYLSLFLTLLLAVVRGDEIPHWITLPFNLTLTFTWLGSVAGGWHAGWHGAHWYMGDLLFHQIAWRWAFPRVYKLSDLSCFFLMMVCMIITVARCFFINWGLAEQEVTYWPVYTFNQFLSGTCLAKLYMSRSSSPSKVVSGDPFALMVGSMRIPLSGLASLSIIIMIFDISPNVMHQWFRYGIWSGILLPLFILLVWCLCLEDGPLDWLCQRKPFCWMGEVSYGVYVFHWNALMLTQKYGHVVFPDSWSAPFRFWCVILPLTTLFSAFIMVFFDRPIQAWASNFLRRSPAASAHAKSA